MVRIPEVALTPPISGREEAKAAPLIGAAQPIGMLDSWPRRAMYICGTKRYDSRSI